MSICKVLWHFLVSLVSSASTGDGPTIRRGPLSPFVSANILALTHSPLLLLPFSGRYPLVKLHRLTIGEISPEIFITPPLPDRGDWDCR